MSRAILLPGIALLVACEVPPLALRFAITDGESQRCISDTGNPTTSCSDITMLCDRVLSIRIVPPDDPTVPYISVCQPLTGGQDRLCSIAGIDLPRPTVPVPEQVLEVQMAVFRASDVPRDPITNELVCPRVQFGANGLPIPAEPQCDDSNPISCPIVPAVGGRTFYYPGDNETIVELGCTQLEKLTDEVACLGVQPVTVTASVNDFDDLVSSVDRLLADRLDISIGEPTVLGDERELKPGDSHELARVATTSVPAWSSKLVDFELESSACLEVKEDGAETTTALTCRPYPPAIDRIDMAGVFLKKAALGQILKTLALDSFPPKGLVIGMVIDEFFNPLANVAVSCGGCTIEYLSANRDAVVMGSTSASGVFVSRDAPYGTVFTIPSNPTGTFGGRVRDKVTIVVIQDKVPVGN